MKKLFFTVAMVLSFAWCMAASVTTQTAQRVAETFWKCHASQTNAKADLVRGTAFTHLYIFDFQDATGSGSLQRVGFVIVAADDCAYPILGYSTDSPVAQEGIPENVAFWLGQYEEEIAYLREHTQEIPAAQTSYIQQMWQELINGTYSQPKRGTSVSPMLTTTWDQSPYYNKFCPAGTPVGCSATATAQVMKYWNYPVVGVGSHSYATADYGIQSADYEHTVYDWTNMPNRLSSSSSTTQVDAVATLSYHVGVSMNMDYGPSGSGANIIGSSSSAQYGLINYFGYKSTMQGLYKRNYTDAQWVEMLEDEIDAGRPVIYAGFDPSAGHAFVFDGYNSSDQFHVNWGWSGSYNGYFAMGALNPTGGGTGSNTSNTFNQSNQALFGVEPDYRLMTSPSSLVVTSDATTSSIHVVSNHDVASSWSAVSDASWLVVSPSTGSGSGSLTNVTLSADENISGATRSAHVTFVQGGDTAVVTVCQTGCYSEEQCSLTVNMSDRHGDGWEGAYITLSSTSGTVYGTATVGGGSYGMTTISVCPDTVVATFHQGRTDSECGFFIENAEGTVWVNHLQGSSFSSGYTFVIPNPCDTAGGLGAINYTLSAVARDTAMGYVQGGGTGLRFGTQRSLKAMANPGYRFTQWTDGSTENPRNVVVTSDQYLTAVFADLGTDTLQYDHGGYTTSLGAGSQIQWGIKIPDCVLPGRREITGLKFYNTSAGTYTIHIYEGGETKPTTELYSGSVNLSSSYSYTWITLNLEEPIAIKQNKPLWVTLSSTNVSYPAAMAEWCGNDDGGMISTNGGSSWKSLTQIDRIGTWMIRPIIPFDSTHYSISARAENDTMGTVEGGGRYLYGTRVSLKAVPNEGYRFVRWSDESTYNPHNVVVREDAEYTAIFAPKDPQAISAAETSDIRLSLQGRNLTVQGCEGLPVQVFDIQGRRLYSAQHYQGEAVELPAAGIYIVSLSGSEMRRVVVL